MPWMLLVLVAGLVLRFGVDGYNALGDILIGISAILTVLQLIFAAAVFSHIKRSIW